MLEVLDIHTDLTVGVATVKKNREWFHTKAMQQIGLLEVVPGPQYASDAAIAAQLRNITLSSWQHPSGLLGMLPRKHGGVVDSELRVYGVNGLRVVDASIFPIIPATYTTPAVYAVAEKVMSLVRRVCFYCFFGIFCCSTCTLLCPFLPSIFAFFSW